MNAATAREWKGRTKAAIRSWPELSETLLRDLGSEARTSEESEVYCELVRMPACRLGLTVSVSSSEAVRFVVEVLVDRWTWASRIEAVLSRRGYASTRLDNGWVAHEREVPRARLAAEWRFLLGLLERMEPDGPIGTTREGF